MECRLKSANCGPQIAAHSSYYLTYEEKTVAVQGNLKDMNLLNIVQNICLDQRKTLLVLRHQIEEGSIFFEGGQIVHATLGVLEGEEAVYHLLNWADGTFHVSNFTIIPHRTIATSWEHLLMEGMRRLDEQEATNVVPVQDEEAITPIQIQQDETLESDLFTLLTRIEQMLARLGDEKNQKRPALALQILTDIVNEVVTVSEIWLDAEKYADSLDRALAKTGNIYPAAQLLQVRQNKLSGEVTLKLYNSWPGDKQGRRQMFEQIYLSMLDVLETFFSLLTACFHSPSTAGQNWELCNIFLADLTQTTGKIQF